MYNESKKEMGHGFGRLSDYREKEEEKGRRRTQQTDVGRREDYEEGRREEFGKRTGAKRRAKNKIEG